MITAAPAARKQLTVDQLLSIVKAKSRLEVYKHDLNKKEIVFLDPPIVWRYETGNWHDLVSGKKGNGLNYLISYAQSYFTKKLRSHQLEHSSRSYDRAPRPRRIEEQS